jgi:hypothetical protein
LVARDVKKGFRIGRRVVNRRYQVTCTGMATESDAPSSSVTDSVTS